MKVAIDSYCYHRFFGEIYPGLEQDPGQRMSLLDFVDRAVAHGVQGVSLESFMLDGTDPVALRARLDAAGLERVWAWGHPRGLASGTEADALGDLFRHVDIAAAMGANVMRICAGGRRTRTLSWTEHRTLLLPLLQCAADYAAGQHVVLAIENHIDLSTDEMIELVQTLDHPSIGVCLDTANNLRLFEDAAVAIERLAPYAKAVHLKDITAFRGSPREFGFWPSVPLGRGLIDIPRTLGALRDADYSGLLALEIDFLHPDYAPEEAAIAESIAHLRSLLSLEPTEIETAKRAVP
jgi:sugar phosphate isomerase/epimerase